MNSDTPGEEKPGTAPGESRKTASEIPAEKHGFALRPGGRKGKAGAPGGSHQPHPKLEVIGHDVAGAATEQAAGSSETDSHAEAAARMMHAMDDEVDQIRRGAGRLIPFHPAGKGGLERAGAELGHAFSRVKNSLQRAAQQKPVQTFAACVGIGFAVGAVLRLWIASRR